MDLVFFSNTILVFIWEFSLRENLRHIFMLGYFWKCFKQALESKTDHLNLMLKNILKMLFINLAYIFECLN